MVVADGIVFSTPKSQVPSPKSQVPRPVLQRDGILRRTLTTGSFTEKSDVPLAIKRKFLWKALLDIAPPMDHLWLIGGDFNAIVQTRGKQLDRCLMNDGWFQRFPNANVMHLERLGSDHCPLLVKLGALGSDVAIQPFRFLAAWQDHWQAVM
ncbi:hypothetical protein V6N11_083780 [Hibiscus sabdariffa]|uniref:Endonuclease/exonuclease/phosphatase domain-containing protein n=1 Tax=Hibiscus sabdariffa TaxID=183260 RepID=A0ABR2QCU3_9ROSI